MRAFLSITAIAIALVILAGCGGQLVGLGKNEAPPNASFTASPQTSTTYPILVNMDASASSDPDGGAISLYEWDFDFDGMTPNITASGGSPTTNNTYNSPGTYVVWLRVTDDEGATATTTRTIQVFPAASVTSTPNIVCIGRVSAADDQVTFDASGSNPGPGANITLYEWDFNYGAGPFSADASTTPPTATYNYTYAAANDYIAAVRITTDAPGSGTDTIAVKVVELTASFTMPGSGAPGIPVDFDASGCTANNTTITNYHWDFGDGTADTASPTIQHTYSAENTYSVSLTITDENGFTDTVSQSFVVADLAAVIYSNTAPPGGVADYLTLTANAPVLVQMSNEHSVGTITEYAWAFEHTSPTDPTGATWENISASATTDAVPLTHTYSTPGTYYLWLRIFDGTTYAYDVVTITANAPPLLANCKTTAGAIIDPNAQNHIGGETPALPYVYYINAGSFPATITADASDSTGAIIGHEWNFGDGTGPQYPAVATDPTITHDFTAEGIYMVTIKVDDGASTDLASMIITVVDTGSGHSYLSHFLDHGTTAGDQDASIHEGSPDTNYGDNHIHCDGYTGETQHLLWQCDVTAEVGSDTILSAGLIIFCYRENGAGGASDTLSMYRCTSAWDEAVVTWNTGAPTWDTGTDYMQGGPWLAPDIAMSNDENPPHPFFWPCTTLIADWVATPANNYGAAVVANDRVDLSFCSDGYQGNTRNPIVVGILQ
ncbi:MAG: PKD domain-containing protein [Planctomycetes bacterium]|nr:PKD domain-containing protein [Planctomycetota bacterium]